MAYFLSCANLTSPTCTLGDYVIDWALNSVDGDIVFVSANQGNEEEGVDAYHPLVDEITPAGTLYPIIRYVYISGVKNTADYEDGALYSPDLKSCLSPIVIDPIDCAASNFTPTTALPYDFRIIRDVGEGSKDRTFHFEIGATTEYFAWGFYTDNISDQIKIYYCTLADPDGTLIDNLVAGTDAITNITPISYPTNPIIIDNANNSVVVKYVSDLTSFSYTVGDFIKIEIIGNYYNPSLDDTRWTIYMRCLEELGPLPDMTPVFNKTGNVVMNYNTISCQYEFVYPVEESLTTYTEYLDSDLVKYFHILTNGNPIVPSSNHYQLNHLWSEVNSYNSPPPGWSIPCVNLAGTVNVAKVGSVVTWTFSDTSDYDSFKSAYDSVVSTATSNGNFSANPVTDVKYYSSFNCYIFTNLNTCDSSPSSFLAYISLHSSWTFDPVDKITISATLVDMNYVLDDFGDCNNFNETSLNLSNLVNSFKALADFSYTSVVRNNAFIGSSLATPQYPGNPSGITIQRRRIYDIMLNNIYTPSNALGYVLSSGEWRIYPQYERNRFGDTTSHITRSNSWCLERSRFFTTLDQADLGIYDVIECAPPTTTTTTTV